ncbi:MAG: carboxylating nicotinate-nucleotide diphosphorylase [Candidatus Brocadiia bacterium]
MDSFKSLDQIIKLALEEDCARNDITSKALIGQGRKARGYIIAKEPGIIGGLFLVPRIYKFISKNVHIAIKAKEGESVKEGRVLATMSGDARAILAGERTVINFLQRVCGIATYTNKFIQQIRGFRTKLLDTRKTVPGWRSLDKYAVKLGGGTNHRMNMAESFLIKDNHKKLISLENITKMMTGLKKYKKVIEVEVETIDELVQVLRVRPTVIMLDNMDLKTITQAVKIVEGMPAGQRPLLEVSGGVNLRNVRNIAKTDVDFISVGAITHSAPALDISLEIE